MRILVLNGPNLNLLGTRQPKTYGTTTLEELTAELANWGSPLGVEIEAVQSNHEGELVDAVQASTHDGIVFNPGALSHTSRALADAVMSVDTPVVEVHISNIREREPWRAVSTVSEVCERTIYGRGAAGYRHAILHLLNRSERPHREIRYGPHQDNVGDLRRGNGPLAVLVHGGFWRHEWERDTMESLAVDLTKQGFHTWNIEYRRIGLGGGWPGSAHDVLMALDHIPQLELDQDAVALVGHSAGAQLAMWAAPRSRVDVSRMVALAPLTDLVMHANTGLQGADEAQLFLRSGAPPLTEGGPQPTLVVHGESDPHINIEHSTRLAGQGAVELLTAPGAHFELLDPRRNHWPQSVAFLRGSF